VGNLPPDRRVAAASGAARLNFTVRLVPGLDVPAIENGKQRVTRASHAALDRPDRAATDLRRLLVGEAARADEDQGRALPRRQRAERAIEVAQLEIAIVVGRHARLG